MKHPPTVRHWIHSGYYYCYSWYDWSWYVCLSSSYVLFLLLGWDFQETGIKFPSTDLFFPSWNYKRSPASCISWSPCMALPWLSYCGHLPDYLLEELLPSSELQVKLAAQVPPWLLGGQESSTAPTLIAPPWWALICIHTSLTLPSSPDMTLHSWASIIHWPSSVIFPSFLLSFSGVSHLRKHLGTYPVFHGWVTCTFPE